MSLLISCDRYHITDNGAITIPISTADAAHIGSQAHRPWVTISDSVITDPDSRYDREENIEDVMRVNAAFAHTPDIYLTSPMDFINGMTPRHVTRYKSLGEESVLVSPLQDTTAIDPKATIIGPLGTYYSSFVTDLFSSPDRYAFKEHLTDFFGRHTVVVDTQDMNNTDIDALEYLVTTNTRVFIKDALSKGPTGTINTATLYRAITSVDFDAETYEYMLNLAITRHAEFEAWGWGLPRFIFIQEPISMQYETRFFYVDGRLISASGRIIDLVPDGNSVYDPFYYAERAVQHASHSNDDQVVECNPHYQDMYNLAQQINAQWSRHEKDAMTCAIDIAWDADHNRAVLVELNSISNSGLYGASAHAVYGALLDTTDGYGGLNYGAMREIVTAPYFSDSTTEV